MENFAFFFSNCHCVNLDQVPSIVFQCCSMVVLIVCNFDFRDKRDFVSGGAAAGVAGKYSVMGNHDSMVGVGSG